LESGVWIKSCVFRNGIRKDMIVVSKY